MPIIDAEGSIFDSPAHALVNPVNCFGVMGGGLAKEFAIRFPDVERKYVEDCRNGHIITGHVMVYDAGLTHDILCFPTKYRIWEPSRIEYIIGGLRSLREVVFRHYYGSIAIPALGCGLGGLDWEEVRPLIVKAFEGRDDVRVYLYAPKEKK